MSTMTLYCTRLALEQTLLTKIEQNSLLIITGPKRSGKTALLKQLAQKCKYPHRLIQLEPLACTPEIFRTEFSRIASTIIPNLSQHKTPIESVADALRERSGDSLLFLDDIMELKALSSFPKVEQPLERILDALKHSRGKTIATSRFAYSMKKHFPEMTQITIPPLSPDELKIAGLREPELLLAVTGGLVGHISQLAEGNIELELGKKLIAGEVLEAECRATMSELLHRARGYGACKAILKILASEEALTLTEVSKRIERTPGSTRDYLKWLEEVDLIITRKKRFYYLDPILRLWVKLYFTGEPPTAEQIELEVRSHIKSCQPITKHPVIEPSSETFDDFMEID